MAWTLFFHMMLRKFMETTNNKHIFSTIFLTNINKFFSNLCSDFFSIHHQKSQSNQEKCSLCCSSPCFHVFLCIHYRPSKCFSKYFHKSKEIGVSRSIFPGYVISCDYALSYQYITDLFDFFNAVMVFITISVITR